MEAQLEREQLRYVLEECMALSVMIGGVHWMPLWSADSWDSLEMVYSYYFIITAIYRTSCNHNFTFIFHSPQLLLYIGHILTVMNRDRSFWTI